MTPDAALITLLIATYFSRTEITLLCTLLATTSQPRTVSCQGCRLLRSQLGFLQLYFPWDTYFERAKTVSIARRISSDVWQPWCLWYLTLVLGPVRNRLIIKFFVIAGLGVIWTDLPLRLTVTLHRHQMFRTPRQWRHLTTKVLPVCDNVLNEGTPSIMQKFGYMFLLCLNRSD